MLIHRKELLSKEENVLELLNVRQFAESLKAGGIDVENFSAWNKLKELRLVSNVVKHGCFFPRKMAGNFSGSVTERGRKKAHTAKNKMDFQPKLTQSKPSSSYLSLKSYNDRIPIIPVAPSKPGNMVLHTVV